MNKLKSTRHAFSLVAAVTFMILALSTSAAAVSEDATQETTVNVTVTSQVAVDVHPQSLDFPSASVGSQVTTSDRGFTAVEVENIGSEYIDRVWLNATQPSSNPFGTGVPTNYDAGNFLQVRPNNQSGLLDGDADDFHFVNRVEFAAASGFPSYIDVDGQFNGQTAAGAGGDVKVGRFRLGDEEYFFALPVGSNGECDGSGDASFNIIRVGNTSHTSSTLGTVDFDDTPDVTGTIDWTEYTIAENANTGYGEVQNVDLWKDKGTASEVNRTYDVMTICDTTKSGVSEPHVIRTRYNIEAGNTTDLTGGGGIANYILNAGITAGDMLTPGDSVTIDTAIEVPQGVSQGDVTQGTLTVLVTANTTAQN